MVANVDYAAQELISNGAQVALATGYTNFSEWVLKLTVEVWRGEFTRYTFTDANNPDDKFVTFDYGIACDVMDTLQ